MVGVFAVLMVLPLLAAAPAVASSGRAVGVGVASVPRAALPKLPDMGVEGHWWFTSWRIPQVWAAGARGQGITVAVVDTGVQASVPELNGVVLPGTDFKGGDGRTDTDTGGEGRGHGTAMATFIAGQGGPLGLVGVAPEAKILPVTGREGSTGIAWAVDHGAKVISISNGLAGKCLSEDAEAVRYALDHGAVVVAGPGNDGPNGPGLAPADCPGAVAVGAFDYQLHVWSGSQQGAYLSFAAPGVHMPTTNLKRQRFFSTGTSDSTALTSGAIALVWSKYPQLTARQVVARVLATALDLGPPGRDDGFGYGAVRPYQAMTSDVPADAPNPIFDAAKPAASTTTSTTAVPSGGVDSPSRSGNWLLVVLGIGVAALVVLALIVVAIAVPMSRRSRRRAQQAAAARYPMSGPQPPPGPGYPGPGGPPPAGPPPQTSGWRPPPG